VGGGDLRLRRRRRCLPRRPAVPPAGSASCRPDSLPLLSAVGLELRRRLLGAAEGGRASRPGGEGGPAGGTRDSARAGGGGGGDGGDCGAGGGGGGGGTPGGGGTGGGGGGCGGGCGVRRGGGGGGSGTGPAPRLRGGVGSAGGAAAAATAAKERPVPADGGVGELGWASSGGARACAAACACASHEWAPGALGRKAGSLGTRTVLSWRSGERSGVVSTLRPTATSVAARRVPNETDASKSACTLEAAAGSRAVPSSAGGASRSPQSS